MYDVIAFVLMSVITVGAITYAIFAYFKNKKLLKAIVEAYIEKTALEDMIKDQAIRSLDNVDQGDGFIKFLSDSREWAFNYIDTVQNEIFVLKEKYDNKKALDETLQKLFDMLPENNKEK
jgi:AcrR family transcriptional regulator